MSAPHPRIAAGVEWLDEHYPTWRHVVSVADLDLGSYCRCVLGQLDAAIDNPDDPDYAHFLVDNDEQCEEDYVSPRHLITSYDANRMGFTADSIAGFGVLTGLWAQELVGTE